MIHWSWLTPLYMNQSYAKHWAVMVYEVGHHRGNHWSPKFEKTQHYWENDLWWIIWEEHVHLACKENHVPAVRCSGRNITVWGFFAATGHLERNKDMKVFYQLTNIVYICEDYISWPNYEKKQQTNRKLHLVHLFFCRRHCSLFAYKHLLLTVRSR